MEVRVGAVVYPVRWMGEVVSDGGKSLYGAVSHVPDDEIYMSNQTSPMRRRETLLHEVIHTIDERFGVGLTEKAVASLSVGLFEFMRENRDVMRWMMGGRK